MATLLQGRFTVQETVSHTGQARVFTVTGLRGAKYTALLPRDCRRLVWANTGKGRWTSVPRELAEIGPRELLAAIVGAPRCGVCNERVFGNICSFDTSHTVNR